MGLRDKIQNLISKTSFSKKGNPSQNNNQKKNKTSLLQKALSIKERIYSKPSNNLGKSYIPRDEYVPQQVPQPLSESFQTSVDQTNQEPTQASRMEEIFDDWEKDALKEAMKVLPSISAAPIVQNEGQAQPAMNRGLNIQANYVPPNPVSTNQESSKQLESSNLTIQLLQQKLESYISLHETGIDIIKSSNLNEFFESMMYSIIGLLGTEYIVIFSIYEESGEKLEIVNYDGIELEEEMFLSSTESIYQYLNKINGSVYSYELDRLNLSQNEKQIVEIIKPKLILPIHSSDKLVSIVFMGDLLDGKEISHDDLEFLKNLASVCGLFYEKIEKTVRLMKDISKIHSWIEFNKTIRIFTKKIKTELSFEHLNKSLEIIMKDMNVLKYSLITLSKNQENFYFAYSNLMNESITKSFLLPAKSKIISNLVDVNELQIIQNIGQNPLLLEVFPFDEIKKSNQLALLPLVYQSKLIGLLLIHELDEQWSNTRRDTLNDFGNILTLAISNLLYFKD